MCGIAGWISNKPLRSDLAETLARGLLFHSAQRGQQSSGVYHADSDTLLKNNELADSFINRQDFCDLWKTPTRAALFHTRMPTSGGRGPEQAQPFRQGNTVTVHNGYYFNIRALKERFNIIKSSGVDSELVTSYIESYGVKLLPRFLESTEGPSAIAALYENNLYLVSAGNPIAYVTLRLGDTTVTIFASTAEILEASLHHAFLLPPSIKPKMLKERRLFHVLPHQLRGLGKVKETLRETPEEMTKWDIGQWFKEEGKHYFEN